MATVQSEASVPEDPQALARLHFLLRFTVGTTAAFILSEVMGWNPTFLAPLLAGVLLANLPTALPLKGALALILVQAFGAYSAFILTTLLNDTPLVLFGSIGLLLFLCFANLAQGRGFLPLLLILIAFATIPVVTMIAPQQAGALPLAFTRGMAVAVGAVSVVHVLWPKVKKGQPAVIAAASSPIALAVTGIAIVLPLMLVFLMYGITDALPILITTIVLVINFDSKRGAMQGFAMMFGNFIGGIVALLAYVVLQIAPSLLALTLISLLIATLFAGRIEKGGPGGAVGLVTYNQAMVIFGLALIKGDANAGIWMTRLFQFAVACFFAIGMMSLLMPRFQAKDAESS